MITSLVVKNQTNTKKTRVTMLWAQNIDTFLGSVVNTMGRAYAIPKENENLHFDLLYLLHLVKLQ